jgi:hypothetical protein
MMRNPLPKALRDPAHGLTIEAEPDDVKAARLLAALRHFAHGKANTLGFTIDGVPMMLIRFRPKPDGPHNPESDLSGIEL